MSLTVEALEALKLEEMHAVVIAHVQGRPDLASAVRAGGTAVDKYRAWWLELGILLDAWGKKSMPPEGWAHVPCFLLPR